MGVSNNSLWAIPLIPLLGCYFVYLIGIRRPSLAGPLATAAALLSFASVCLWSYRLGSVPGSISTEPFPWFSIGGLSFEFGLTFDGLSSVMCLIITGVGTLIHLYSIGYMAHDESRPRFFSYLNLFLFSMLILVLASNLLVLFIGWEGVGLCSYLLIGFWFKNVAFASAARKAFVMNRIGDVAFLLASFLLIYHFGTLDIASLRHSFLDITGADAGSVGIYGLIAALLFLAATGKSAQLPLFTWLPDAMAGPTPVSALIHAATMVTAGLYLLARCYFIFELAPSVSLLVATIGTITALIGATTALVQTDIKKVLAYSTVSQLGFMFVAAGAGAYWVAIFHVVTHAFFKACLFLSAGAVIHGCHHEQDMRKMGGLSRFMPITFACYLLATIAIAGIWPFSGFFSKHAILDSLLDAHSRVPGQAGMLLYVVLTATSLLTAFYMFRSLMLTFHGSYRGQGHDNNPHDTGSSKSSKHPEPESSVEASQTQSNPHEVPPVMWGVMLLLALLSVVSGAYLQDILPEYLSAATLVVAHEPSHGLAFPGLTVFFQPLLGALAAILLYGYGRDLPEKFQSRAGTAGRWVRLFFFSAWFFDEIYRVLVVKPLSYISRGSSRTFDSKIINGFVEGVGSSIDLSGELARGMQGGQVRAYAVLMLAGVAVIAVLAFG